MLSAMDILAFLLAFFILYLALSLLSKFRQKDVFKVRLKELMQYKEYLLQAESSIKRVYRSPGDQPLPWLQKIINKFQQTSEKEQEKIQRLFVKAGFRSDKAYIIYGLSKIVMVFLPASILAFFLFYFTKWDFLYKIMAIIVSGLLGSYSVDFILRQLVNTRQERIRRAFPEALDLMVICTEAGLSLTATIQRVAREISQICPDLGYELALLSIELNMLSDRLKALQNFADRLESPYFKSIVANITQAEQYGTPIVQTMRAIAEQFRFDRLVEAEERAAKLPVLLTLPMMVFIFPCIYIVIIGPAIINVMQHIK